MTLPVGQHTIQLIVVHQSYFVSLSSRKKNSPLLTDICKILCHGTTWILWVRSYWHTVQLIVVWQSYFISLSSRTILIVIPCQYSLELSPCMTNFYTSSATNAIQSYLYCYYCYWVKLISWLIEMTSIAYDKFVVADCCIFTGSSSYKIQKAAMEHLLTTNG